MVQAIKELLQTLEVTQPSEAGGLQVFGLRRKNGQALQYTTLDEALAAGTLHVSEVTEGGNVSTIQVSNKSDALVFLMAGEQLIGAKQNRVLNTSLMVAGRAILPVPVSCVEAARWHSRSRQFASPGNMAHGKLRNFMTGSVGVAYHREGRATSDQAGVWKVVADKLTRMGSASPTQALHQAYEDHRARLAQLLGELPLPAGCCGAAFVLGGTIAGVDLFDQPETLAKLWPKLAGSYAMDALEQPTLTVPVTPETVRQWLLSTSLSKCEVFKSPGLGDDVRLTAPGIVGAGLVVAEHPVHLELFSQN
jgi:hypothetical protein